MSSVSQLVLDLSEIFIERQWKLATAESCTGGGLAYTITNTPGSSAWFERGFVSYSNSSKEEMLGVRHATVSTFGAVSKETVVEMADGTLRHSQAQVSAAITGIAGPDGGSAEKPVGLVWFAWAGANFKTTAKMAMLTGNRSDIREQAILFALTELKKNLSYR